LSTAFWSYSCVVRIRDRQNTEDISDEIKGASWEVTFKRKKEKYYLARIPMDLREIIDERGGTLSWRELIKAIEFPHKASILQLIDANMEK
jgi:hypothetical protein